MHLNLNKKLKIKFKKNCKTVQPGRARCVGTLFGTVSLKYFDTNDLPGEEGGEGGILEEPIPYH